MRNQRFAEVESSFRMLVFIYNYFQSFMPFAPAHRMWAAFPLDYLWMKLRRWRSFLWRWQLVLIAHFFISGFRFTEVSLMNVGLIPPPRQSAGSTACSYFCQSKDGMTLWRRVDRIKYCLAFQWEIENNKTLIDWFASFLTGSYCCFVCVLVSLWLRSSGLRKVTQPFSKLLSLGGRASRSLLVSGIFQFGAATSLQSCCSQSKLYLPGAKTSKYTARYATKNSCAGFSFVSCWVRLLSGIWALVSFGVSGKKTD